MSGIFGFNEVAAIAAWSVIVFTQFSKQGGRKDKKWYQDNKPSWSPPASWFPIIWMIMYSALVTAMFYFTKYTQPDSWNLIVGVVLFIFHMYWNKMWSVYFWEMDDPQGALYILMYHMILSAAGLMVTFIVNQTGLYWVPVMLLSIYSAWLLYAAALNIYWVNKQLETRTRQPCSKK